MLFADGKITYQRPFLDEEKTSIESERLIFVQDLAGLKLDKFCIVSKLSKILLKRCEMLKKTEAKWSV